jgi:hypothetical protein
VASKSPLCAAPPLDADASGGRLVGAKKDGGAGFRYALYQDLEALVRRVFDCPPERRVFCITVEAERAVHFFADLEFEMHARDSSGETETRLETAAALLDSSIAVRWAHLEERYGSEVARHFRGSLVCYTATTAKKYSFHLHSRITFESVYELDRLMKDLRHLLEGTREIPRTGAAPEPACQRRSPPPVPAGAPPIRSVSSKKKKENQLV